MTQTQDHLINFKLYDLSLAGQKDDEPSLEGIGRTPVYVQSTDTTNLFDVDRLGDFYKKAYLEGSEIASVLYSCGKYWLKFWCEEGHHYLLKKKLCHERRYCPICADDYKRSKVGHAIETFKKLRNLYTGQVYLTQAVITFPKELWDEVGGDIDKAFGLVYRLFDYQFGGMSGGVVSLHLWHSKDPLKGLYPHFHVIIPNVVLKKEGFNRFVRVRPFFNVDWFKMRFKQLLIKFYGFRCDEVNVHFSYCKLDNVVHSRHLLNYAFRSPIEDLYPYLNNCLSHEKIEFAKSLLDFKGHRIRWFGFLADGVKSYYVKGYVKFARWLKDNGNLCPIHHSKLVLIQKFLDRPPPDAILL